ncbi:MAG: hypothetical protein JXQ87_14525 [Bacteroidia bacterium]
MLNLSKNKVTLHPELDSGSVAIEYTTFKQIPIQVWNDLIFFSQFQITG